MGALIVGWAYRWRSVWSAVLFLAYLQWLHPVLLRKELFATAYGAADVPMGLLLIAAQGLEWVGAQIKFACLVRRPSHGAALPIANLLLLGATGLFRFLYVFLLLMTICIVFGYHVRQNEGWGLLLGLFFLMILKEGTILKLIYQPTSYRLPRWPGLQSMLQRWPFSGLLEMVAELLLLLGAATGFTSTWDYLAATVPPIEPNARAMGYLGAGVMFSMLYLASRLVFLVEENLFVASPWQRWLGRGLFVAALLICLAALPVAAG